METNKSTSFINQIHFIKRNDGFQMKDEVNNSAVSIENWKLILRTYNAVKPFSMESKDFTENFDNLFMIL